MKTNLESGLGFTRQHADSLVSEPYVRAMGQPPGRGVGTYRAWYLAGPLVAMELLAAVLSLEPFYYSHAFTFRCCALSWPEGGCLDLLFLSFPPPTFLSAPAVLVQFSCCSLRLTFGAKSHLQVQLSESLPCQPHARPWLCRCWVCADRSLALSALPAPRPQVFPWFLPVCPWPVVCVHGPAVCLWGSWHPYLGFSAISTCSLILWSSLSYRQVGRAPWRTRVSPHPRAPAVSVPGTWFSLSSFLSVSLPLSSHLGTVGPHGTNVWVCSASPPQKDTRVLYHHLVSQHGFTFYRPVHRSRENVSSCEMISFFFPFLSSWYRTSSRSSLCTQLSGAPPSGAVAQAFLLTSCRGFQPRVLFFSSTFWPRSVACGVLVPWPGIEPEPSALEVWSLNPWTAREAPAPCPKDDRPSRSVPCSRGLGVRPLAGIFSSHLRGCSLHTRPSGDARLHPLVYLAVPTCLPVRSLLPLGIS